MSHVGDDNDESINEGDEEYQVNEDKIGKGMRRIIEQLTSEDINLCAAALLVVRNTAGEDVLRSSLCYAGVVPSLLSCLRYESDLLPAIPADVLQSLASLAINSKHSLFFINISYIIL